MLIIEALSHVYPGGVKALDDVDLTIGPGVFGLLGPNGAGKSSLMRIVATLQKPSAGFVRFGAIDVVRQPEALRAVLGYLPQDFGVYPRVSAREMLDHLAVLKGVAGKGARREHVEALLRQVNLWSHRDKPLGGFSGGMRQRFGVAQALIGAPALIIVDEPTAGLDPEERNRFLDILAEIGERVVVLLSTHIVADVADLCPAMAILCDGRIVRRGAPGELRRELSGRLWMKTLDKAELTEARASLTIISSRLRAGRTVVHVLADAAPGPGYVATAGDLEDVYFSALSGRLAAHPAAAA